MTPLEQVQRVYPDAYVCLDPAAWAVGYGKPWQVWSTQDDDMQLLGEGANSDKALADALVQLPDCPDCGQTDHGGRDCPARQPHPALDPRD